MDDHELLRRYAEEASDDAFRGLVERHAGLVYGVALRQLGRTHQAEEVTHAVFEALARKAAGLRSGTVLAGWLFKATRFAASKLQRDEFTQQRIAPGTRARCDLNPSAVEPDQVFSAQGIETSPDGTLRETGRASDFTPL